MRTHTCISVGLLVLLGGAAAVMAAAARPSESLTKPLDQPVKELDLARTPLKNALALIGRAATYAIVLDPEANIDAEQPVTGYMKSVPARAALDGVLYVARRGEPLGWTLVREKTVLVTTESRLWAQYATPFEYRNLTPEVMQFADTAFELSKHGQPPVLANPGFAIKAPLSTHAQLARVAHWMFCGTRDKDWEQLTSLKQRLYSGRYAAEGPGAPLWNHIRLLVQKAGVPLVVDEASLSASGIAIDGPVAVRTPRLPPGDVLDQLLSTGQKVAGAGASAAPAAGNADKPYVDVISDGEMLCLTADRRRARHFVEIDVRQQAAAKLGLSQADTRRNPAQFVKALEDALEKSVAARGDTLGAKLALVNHYHLLCYQSLDTLLEICQFLGQGTGGSGRLGGGGKYW